MLPPLNVGELGGRARHGAYIGTLTPDVKNLNRFASGLSGMASSGTCTHAFGGNTSSFTSYGTGQAASATVPEPRTRRAGLAAQVLNRHGGCRRNRAELPPRSLRK